MGDLSRNFNRSEFACRCGCGADTVDGVTIYVLENIREHFGRCITITSGYRCRARNSAEGGTSKSQHMLGRAVDFKVKGVKPKVVQEWIKANHPWVSIGHYDSFTHIDSRLDGPKYW